MRAGRGPEAIITSTKNPRLRAAASLRGRGARDETGLTLVDGTRELTLALAGGASVVEVFADAERLSAEGEVVVAEARRRGARSEELV